MSPAFGRDVRKGSLADSRTTTSKGPLRVSSRRPSQLPIRSAFGGEADVNHSPVEGPLIVRSGLSPLLAVGRYRAHRDAGGGAIHSIRSGRNFCPPPPGGWTTIGGVFTPIDTRTVWWRVQWVFGDPSRRFLSPRKNPRQSAQVQGGNSLQMHSHCSRHNTGNVSDKRL